MLHRKFCKGARCNNTTLDRSGYCDSCRAKYARELRQQEDRTSERYQIRHRIQTKGYTTRMWRNFSHQFLADHPVCEICGAKAEVVDHKTMTAFQMIDAFGQFILDVDMYQSLCIACNNRKKKADALSDQMYLEQKQKLSQI